MHRNNYYGTREYISLRILRKLSIFRNLKGPSKQFYQVNSASPSNQPMHIYTHTRMGTYDLIFSLLLLIKYSWTRSCLAANQHMFQIQRAKDLPTTYMNKDAHSFSPIVAFVTFAWEAFRNFQHLPKPERAPLNPACCNAHPIHQWMHGSIGTNNGKMLHMLPKAMNTVRHI